MYDAVVPACIPAGALVVAGYVDGNWPTMDEVRKRFPFAKHISIATRSTSVADILDVEVGDATPDDVVRWLELAHAGGIERPGVYTSVARMRRCLDVAHAAGWTRPRLKVWTAHWTDREHLCGPECGFGLATNAGATQWRGAKVGEAYDVSLATPTFLNS